MHIYCVGLNHTTASLDLRERLAIGEDDARSILARVDHESRLSPVQEMVIVSTCNRTELYYTCEQSEFDKIEAFLSDECDLPVRNFANHVYKLSDEAVVDHLYRVATGLNSLVLGEPQILGQVTSSLETALEIGSCGTVLSNLFRAAIHAGKRARAETGISRNPASISSLAAALIGQEVRVLAEAQVVIVGAGEMAELAVEALRKRGVAQVVVINRTLKRAQVLAQRWQARMYTFKQLDEWLLKADIVISSTSAPHTLISTERMKKIMRLRSGRPIIMIDIAVPRDIDADVNRIPGVKLFDIDTLDDQVEQSLAARSAEVPRVEAILEEEKAQFMEYLKTLDMLPLITGLRKQAETIRNQELERTFHRLTDLTETERAHIEAMTKALVKKLLASPTQRLRAEANCPHGLAYATVARTLFDLQEESGVCAFSHETCTLPTKMSCREGLS